MIRPQRQTHPSHSQRPRVRMRFIVGGCLTLLALLTAVGVRRALRTSVADVVERVGAQARGALKGRF